MDNTVLLVVSVFMSCLVLAQSWLIVALTRRDLAHYSFQLKKRLDESPGQIIAFVNGDEDEVPPMIVMTHRRAQQLLTCEDQLKMSDAANPPLLEALLTVANEVKQDPTDQQAVKRLNELIDDLNNRYNKD